MPDGGDSPESLTPKYLTEETKEDKINPQVRGQEGMAAVGLKGDAEMALRGWSSQGSSVQMGSGESRPGPLHGEQEAPGEARPSSGCIRAVTGNHEF